MKKNATAMANPSNASASRPSNNWIIGGDLPGGAFCSAAAKQEGLKNGNPGIKKKHRSSRLIMAIDSIYHTRELALNNSFLMA
jgi:hypothetical protein